MLWRHDGHSHRRTLHELAHYPEHGPRKSDHHYNIFERARHHLIDVLGVGCWIGGATQQQIYEGLPSGHRCHGATQLEAHHAIAEFAGLNAVDWRKVAVDFPELGVHSNEDFLRAANDEGGLMILCSVHHRSPSKGIHSITYPVWQLDRYAQDDWEFLED
jgi:hypothetical protein